MAKGNKELLAGVNYSIDIVKKVKANEPFNQNDKEDILHNFVGTSSDNNSYFTPYEVCYFIKQLLHIESGKIADLSGGIGNMIKPFIKEYGKLHKDIQFYIFEYDENNSIAGEMAWSDFDQVNFNGQFDSLARHEEIPSDYDFVIGNPPFSGTEKYWSEWNQNKNGSAKNNNLADAFVDLAIRKVKDKGYIALVLPYGHLYKGNATAKLREWMKNHVALKGVFPLDKSTFEDAGINGTSVGTVLCIFQKGVPQEKVFMGEMVDNQELEQELASMAQQFRLFMSGDYDIVYVSDSASGLHGKMDKSLQPWVGDPV